MPDSQHPSCAVANCRREGTKAVQIVGVNGRDLAEFLQVWVCQPCFDDYGLADANASSSEVRDA
jgi:hypothetical protein